MAQRTVKTPDGAAGLWGAALSSNAFDVAAGARHARPHDHAPDEADPDVVVLIHHSGGSLSLRPVDRGQSPRVQNWRVDGADPGTTVDGDRLMPPDFRFPTGANDSSHGSSECKAITEVTMCGDARRRRDAAGGDRRGAVMGTRSLRVAAASTPPNGPRFDIQSLTEQTVAPLRRALRVLLAAVAVVLLSCARMSQTYARAGHRATAARDRRASRRRRKPHTECRTRVDGVAHAGDRRAHSRTGRAAGVTLVNDLATIDAPEFSG